MGMSALAWHPGDALDQCKTAQQQHAADGSQPIGSVTIRSSLAAGFHRSC
jgi:hypothetical protein